MTAVTRKLLSAVLMLSLLTATAYGQPHLLIVMVGLWLALVLA